MCVHLKFDHRKATQALNYMAEKAGGKIDKLKALKLVYFADRFHIRKYGRPITGDEYFAMEYGPVASGVKDVAEDSTFLGVTEKSYARRFIKRVNTKTYQSIAAVELSVFSDSDIEALRYSWDTFANREPFKLVELTHKYPEWKKHEKSLSPSSTRVKMDYEDFLDDPTSKVPACHPLTEEQRELLREHLREQSRLAKFFLAA